MLREWQWKCDSSVSSFMLGRLWSGRGLSYRAADCLMAVERFIHLSVCISENCVRLSHRERESELLFTAAIPYPWIHVILLTVSVPLCLSVCLSVVPSIIPGLEKCTCPKIILFFFFCVNVIYSKAILSSVLLAPTYLNRHICDICPLKLISRTFFAFIIDIFPPNLTKCMCHLTFYQ